MGAFSCHTIASLCDVCPCNGMRWSSRLKLMATSDRLPLAKHPPPQITTHFEVVFTVSRKQIWKLARWTPPSRQRRKIVDKKSTWERLDYLLQWRRHNSITHWLELANYPYGFARWDSAEVLILSFLCARLSRLAQSTTLACNITLLYTN
jgi:hypothetical protein